MAIRNPLQQIEDVRRDIDRAFEDAGLGVLGRGGRWLFYLVVPLASFRW
jgi:hypothetical protein